LFFGGIMEVAPLGQPRVQQAGDFALVTLRHALIPPLTMPGGRLLVYPVPGSRRIRMTRPATDGTFIVVGLPAGDYLLAALADLEPGEWNDPTLLAQLAASSLGVTLRERATTTQDVRIGGR
jgi:hypothetical protein